MTDFVQMLLDMRSGAVAADVNAKFNTVLRAVLDTAGKGELIIKLSIRPAKMGMGGAVVEVETEHDVKVKAPELKVGSAMFFVDKEGNLSRDDPNQTAMFDLEQEREALRKEKK